MEVGPLVQFAGVVLVVQGVVERCVDERDVKAFLVVINVERPVSFHQIVPRAGVVEDELIDW